MLPPLPPLTLSEPARPAPPVSEPREKTPGFADSLRDATETVDATANPEVTGTAPAPDTAPETPDETASDPEATPDASEESAPPAPDRAPSAAPAAPEAQIVTETTLPAPPPIAGDAETTPLPPAPALPNAPTGPAVAVEHAAATPAPVRTAEPALPAASAPPAVPVSAASREPVAQPATANTAPVAMTAMTDGAAPITDSADAGTDRGDSRDTPNRDGRRATQTAPGASSVATPAVARAELVEQSIQVETLTGRPAEQEPAPRVAQAARITAASSSPVAADAEPGARSSIENAFASRVVRGLSAMVNQRGGVMTMRLDPPELGQLRVQMSLQAGVVSAKFFAEQGQARSLLERSLGTLKAALESGGLTVERLSVQGTESTNDGGETRNETRGDRDAGDGASRGRREHHGGRRVAAGDFAGFMETAAAVETES